jgi:hypothetical protein
MGKKKSFPHEICYFLGGDVLKGQRVMSVKWENFGAFLS